jgi:hypothetical protein
VELVVRAEAKQLCDEKIFEFGASHEAKNISLKRFGSIQFMVPRMHKT